MKIEYKVISRLDGGRVEITNIISEDGMNVYSFGYSFNDLVMKKGEIISEKEFRTKIQIIRESEKKALGEIKGKVEVNTV